MKRVQEILGSVFGIPLSTGTPNLGYGIHCLTPTDEKSKRESNG